MAQETYNGWTNYETWMVGLWFNDGFDGEPEWLRSLDADDYRDWVWDYLENLDGTLDGFVADVVTGFLARVNWAELADHVREANQ